MALICQAEGEQVTRERSALGERGERLAGGSGVSATGRAAQAGRWAEGAARGELGRVSWPDWAASGRREKRPRQGLLDRAAG